MPASDSPAVIVARFLKTNRLTETYEAFIAESGLSEDFPPDGLTIEQLLEEKKAFDYSLHFEKLQIETKTSASWTDNAPQHPTTVLLPAAANVISIDGAEVEDGTDLLVATADRNLYQLNPAEDVVRKSLIGMQDSPVLSSLVLQKRHLLSSSMSGQLVSANLDGSVLESRRDHTKYLTKIVYHKSEEQSLLVTAGWDGKLSVYDLKVTADSVTLSEPFATLTLPSKPESLILINHPEANQPIIVVTRSNSSFLYYYTTEPTPRLLGRQNLAPHSNAWVAFTPASIALSPTNPTLLAIATSTIPHLKLIIVKLLIPAYSPPTTTDVPSVPRSLLDNELVPDTQASQARRELSIAAAEQDAIKLHVSTLAPQTPYSTPTVVWRPDGSGVWVNGDDGAIRGVEVATGKVVVTLVGHEAGSKVRCLWGGMVGGREVLYSGGFDQRLISWR